MQDYLRPNFQRLRSEPEDVMRTAFERAHKAIYEAIKRQPDTFEQVRVCPLAAGARVSVSMSWGECPAPAPFTRSKRQIPRTTFEQDMDAEARAPSAKGMGKMLVMEVDEEEWELGYDAVHANPNPTPNPTPNPNPNPNPDPHQVRRRGRWLDGLGRRDHRRQHAGVRGGGRLVLTLRRARALARRHADNHRADPRALTHQRAGVGGPAA